MFAIPLLRKLGQVTLSYFLYRTLREIYNEMLGSRGRGYILRCDGCNRTYRGPNLHICPFCGCFGQVRLASSRERNEFVWLRQFPHS